jgi:hypothetical protein
MQLSSITTAAPTTPAAPVTTHQELGTMKFMWGLEECEVWHSRDAIRAGAPVGAAGGYATLAAAVKDLTPATLGDAAPAALVLREGDHFVARTLQAKMLSGYEQGAGDAWHTVDERPSNMDILEVRPTADLDPRVAAIVDGRLVHTFRAR